MNKMKTLPKTFTAAERIERLPLTRYQIKIFSVVALAWFFDIIDIAMMTYALAAIKDHFQLSKMQVGMLGSSSFAGMALGAILSGILGDKFGRKAVLQWSIIIWGIASFLCAQSATVDHLIMFRVLLGLGMGMELPAGQALISELASAKYRGRAIALLEGFVPLGAISAGIIACIILPVGGWRGLFVVQGILSVVVLIVRKYMPESPRWLEQVGKDEEANLVLIEMENGTAAALVESKLPEPKTITATRLAGHKANIWHRLCRIWSSGYSKRTTMLSITWFLVLNGYHGLNTWLGTMLHARGYSINESNLWMLLSTTAGIPGFLTAMWSIEKWGRKLTLITSLLGMALGFCLFGTAANIAQIILYGAIMKYFMYSMWCPLYVYTPELYETNIRTTGTGWASTCGRLGSMIGPFLIGMIASQFGQASVFNFGAGLLLLAAIVVLVLGEETKGQLLENISPGSL
jgi:MFS transporter, putative metabolite:H+ symporter